MTDIAVIEDGLLARGSRKGEETRRRILDVALKEFGAAGLAGATTRRIAEQAAVNLPALRYYFGSKEGLYLACAREIVGEYQARMLVMLAGAKDTLDQGMTREGARAGLKSVLRALVDIQIGGARSDIWMSFVLREISEQGPAFRLLFEQLWSPGVDLTADLIGCVLGERPQAGQRSERARVQALLLISSLSAFSVARPIALKYLDWPKLDPASLEQIKQVLDAQIDQIA